MIPPWDHILAVRAELANMVSTRTEPYDQVRFCPRSKARKAHREQVQGVDQRMINYYRLTIEYGGSWRKPR